VLAREPLSDYERSPFAAIADGGRQARDLHRGVLRPAQRRVGGEARAISDLPSLVRAKLRPPLRAEREGLGPTDQTTSALTGVL